MAKKKNFNKLYDSLKESGWISSHAQEIYDAIADAYLLANPDRKSYADYLDALSNVAYQDELEKNIRPFVKNYALKLSRANQGTDYDRDNLRNFLKSTSNGIDREKFLNILGRKAAEEVDNEGKKVKKDRHIGKLTDEDYDNLYLEGYDRDYADELAEKYRNEYIKDFAAKEMAKMPKALEEAKKKVVKEYQKDPRSGLLKALAPEYYAEGVKAMGRGEDFPEGAERRAIMSDVGRNAGIVASASMPNPFMTGLGVFGTEMAFNGISPNYKQDVNQAALSGAAAATIPMFLGKAIGGMSRVPIRSLQNAVRRAAKKFRRGEVSPVKQELMDKQDFLDNAIQTFAASRMPGSGVRPKDAEKIVSQVTKKMNESPAAVKLGTAGQWTENSVAVMMGNEEGQELLRMYLAKAPKKNVYLEHSDIIKMPRTASEGAEQNARILSEKWLDAAQNQWPVTTSSFVTLPVAARQRALDYGVEKFLGSVNSLGGVIEPVSTRIGSAIPYGPTSNGGGLILLEDWRRDHADE